MNLTLRRARLRAALLLATTLIGAPLAAQTTTSEPLVTAPTTSGQVRSTGTSDPSPAVASILAMSRDDYRVTPGDVYELAYNTVATPVGNIRTIIVTNDAEVDLGILGTLSGAGLTFPELRARVEARVREAYPQGFAELVIRQVGIFVVYVRGEVTSSRYVQANGLTRLSAIVDQVATPYASPRSVRVTSASGRAQTYDVWLAARSGRVDQNPYVRPGDVIALSRSARTVTVQGEVRRPGTYHLLPADDLEDLIDTYGDGATNRAGDVEIRSLGDGGVYQTRVVSYPQGRSERLRDGDVVVVANRFENGPVILVSGAVYGAPNDGLAAREVPEQPVRVALPFAEGMTVRQALRRVGGPTPFAAGADARVLRADGTTIAFSLDATWSGAQRDVPLVAGDHIEIPFGRADFGPSFGW